MPSLAMAAVAPEHLVQHATSNQHADDNLEMEIEKLLSEKLLQGYLLLEKACPSCATPLVKQQINSTVDKDDEVSHNTSVEPLLVPSESFDQPFCPVAGVPFCVSCQSHVVTEESEVRLLEKSDTLKAKGSILVAIHEAGSSVSSMPSSAFRERKDPDADRDLREIKEKFLESMGKQVALRDPPTSDSTIASGMAAALLCGSTASRQMVVPSPVQHILLQTNLPEEASGEGVEQDLGDHRKAMQWLAKESARSALYPPRPEASDLLNKAEIDEYEAQRALGSPRADEEEEKKNDGDDGLPYDLIQEYSVRREIATKVLGAKMLQGYTLKETQCLKCGMPLMEYASKVDCVVCPVLVKKARKKIKEQHRAATRKDKVDKEVNDIKDNELDKREAEKKILRETMAEANSALSVVSNDVTLESSDVRGLGGPFGHAAEKAALQAIEDARRAGAEAELASNKAAVARAAQAELRLAEESRRIEEAKRSARAAEEARKAEEARRLELEKEEARLWAEARAAEEARLLEEARLIEEERLMREQKLEEQARLAEQARLDCETRSLEDSKRADDARREEQRRLLEETRRLELLERRRLQELPATEKMQIDYAIQEQRKRLAEEAQREEEIRALEEARREAELEAKRLADDKRAEEEERLISALEAEASFKAKLAEEAIAKAKEALEQVSSARRDIIASTIAQAEAEAIAEVEAIVKADAEDFKQGVILPSESTLEKERWNTLRTEGRSVMTRRVMAGWTLLAELCRGEECRNSPLVSNGHKKECVVCGGTGSGKDGVYARSVDEDDDADDDNDEITEVPGNHGLTDRDLASPVNEAHNEPDDVVSPSVLRSVEEIQEDFETKRDVVSKVIGRKMLEGWTLLDVSCPKCVMPLMSDNNGEPNICVLCGPVSLEDEPFTDETENERGIEPPDVDGDETAEQTVQDVSVQRKPDAKAIRPDVEEQLTDYDRPQENDVDGDQSQKKPDARENRYRADPIEKAAEPDTEENLDDGDIEFETQEVREGLIPAQPEQEDLAQTVSQPSAAEDPRLRSTGSPPVVQRVKSLEEILADNLVKSTSVKEPPTSPQDPPDTPSFAGGSRDPEPEMAVKRAAKKTSESDDDGMTLQLPKGFDINDEASVLNLLAILKAKKDGSDVNDAKLPSEIPKNPPLKSQASVPEHSLNSVAERNLGMLENDRKVTSNLRSETALSQRNSRIPEYRRTVQESSQEADATNAARAVLFPVIEEDNDVVATNQQDDDDFIREFEHSLAVGRGMVSRASMETYDDISHLTDPTTYLKSAGGFVHHDQHGRESRFMQSRDETSVPTRSSKQKSRPKITPESIERPRHRKQPPGRSPPALQPKASKVVKPPRPDRSLTSAVMAHNSVNGKSKRLSPRSSPRNSPRSFVVVGGPGPRDDIPSDASDDVSRAETVASQALEAILCRMEDAKASLLSHSFHPRLSKEDIESQSEMATLIEKLASAAVAVRRLEEMG